MSRPLTGLPRGAATFLLAAIVCLAPGVPRAGQAPEYAVKGAFLYNFAKFATWPAGTFSGPDQPLEVCVLGDAPLADEFRALAGKRIGGRPVAVRRVAGAAEAAGCQVLFFAGEAPQRVGRELAAAGGGPVLTVGESEGFCQRGGVINFIVVEGRVRFEINPDAARSRGLRLSSHLLKLARIVPGGGARP